MTTFSTENLPALGTQVYYRDDNRIRGKVIGYATVHAEHYIHATTKDVHTICLVDLDPSTLAGSNYPAMFGSPITCFPCTPDLLSEPRWDLMFADGSIEQVVTYDLVDWQRANPEREMISAAEA